MQCTTLTSLQLSFNSSVFGFVSFRTNSLIVVLDVVLVVGFSQLNCTEAAKQFSKDSIGYTINLAKRDAIAPVGV